MTIEKDSPGVSVRLDASECELLVRLASDLEAATRAESTASRVDTAPSYFSISVELGKRIRALQTR